MPLNVCVVVQSYHPIHTLLPHVYSQPPVVVLDTPWHGIIVLNYAIYDVAIHLICVIFLCIGPFLIIHLLHSVLVTVFEVLSFQCVEGIFDGVVRIGNGLTMYNILDHNKRPS